MEEGSDEICSTVFQAELSADNREVRCGFAHCKCDKKYLPNVYENTMILSRHVTDSVDAHVASLTGPQDDSPEVVPLLAQTARVARRRLKVILAELDDRRCTVARWLPTLLPACLARGAEDAEVELHVARFRSRKQLIERVVLGHLMEESRGCDVALVLSTHASSQGQVFSCTPSEIKDSQHFEEFCSLYDLAKACGVATRAAPSSFVGIYVSSCFVMKMDPSGSHREWPVEAERWDEIFGPSGLLRGDVVGFCKEIYYTGSQTADLFIIASIANRWIRGKDRKGCAWILEEVRKEAETSAFPDLADETGLRSMRAIITGRSRSAVHGTATEEAEEEDVAPAPQIETQLSVLVLHGSAPKDVQVSEGVVQNVSTRSDLTRYKNRRGQIVHRLPFLTSAANETGTTDWIVRTAKLKRRLFVVVVCTDLRASDAPAFIAAAKALSDVLGGCNSFTLYGTHWMVNAELLPSFTTLRGIIPSRNTSYQLCDQSKEGCCLPLALYLIHLCVGENGVVIKAAPDSPLAVPPPPLPDTWELSDVVAECKHVCPGLCVAAGLELLPPVASSSTPGTPDTEGKRYRTRQRKVVNYASMIESQPGVCDPDLRSSLVESDLPRESPPKRRKSTTPRPKLDASSDDLPLSANIDDFRMTSFRLELMLKRVSDQKFYGYVEYVVTALKDPVPDNLVLDMRSIDVESVCLVVAGEPTRSLSFQTTANTLTIKLPPDVRPESFSLGIRYQTQKDGESLLWSVREQCVITGGSPANNRSLLPCPDAESQSLTFDCQITVPEGLSARMSCPLVSSAVCTTDQNFREFLFRMKDPLPCSTMAIAVGPFIEHVVRPTSSIFYLSRYATVMASRLPVLVESVRSNIAKIEELLGSLPYDRYDVVVAFRSFAALGLQNPNMCLLSPSVLNFPSSLDFDSGRMPAFESRTVMLAKLAHEMSHCFFGVLISEADWTETWLSEAFAEYMSDRLALSTIPVSQMGREQEKMAEFRVRVISLLRYRNLMNDLNNTDDFCHVLKQPDHPCRATTATAKAQTPAERNHVIARGMEPTFHSIPYSRGYFFLRHLSTFVGAKAFDRFLHRYVDHFRDKLLGGRQCVDFFFDTFPDLRSPQFNTDTVLADWIQSPRLTDAVHLIIRELCEPKGQVNPFVVPVKSAVDFVTCLASKAVDERSAVPASVDDSAEQYLSELTSQWSSDQLCLFFELLNESGVLGRAAQSSRTRALEAIDVALDPRALNAEVRHRWCELVVKHKYEPGYGEVVRLLVEEPAMGLYVFGELVNNGEPSHVKMARRIYDEVKDSQDRQIHKKMRDMLLTAGLVV